MSAEFDWTSWDELEKLVHLHISSDRRINNFHGELLDAEVMRIHFVREERVQQILVGALMAAECNYDLMRPKVMYMDAWGQLIFMSHKDVLVEEVFVKYAASVEEEASRKW